MRVDNLLDGDLVLDGGVERRVITTEGHDWHTAEVNYEEDDGHGGRRIHCIIYPSRGTPVSVIGYSPW